MVWFLELAFYATVLRDSLSTSDAQSAVIDNELTRRALNLPSESAD